MSQSPSPCSATTGNAFNIDGQTDFHCELPAGHAGPHERKSGPLSGTWENTPTGIKIISMKTG